MSKQPARDRTSRQGRSTRCETPASDKQSPGIGHNSAAAAAQPEANGKQEELMDLQILREILLGPLNEETSARFTGISEHLRQREAEIAQREEALRLQIETVRTDLQAREEALNRKVAMVEADLARREAALMASVAKVEEELTRREDELAESIARLGTDLDRCKAQSAKINTDLTEKLAKACQQQSITIRGIGYAITQLGNHVSELGKTAQPDA